MSSKNFPGLTARIKIISRVSITDESESLEVFKDEVIKKIKEKWNIDDLKEDPVFRAYRDFFWRVRIDPTKNRPASEAIIRRILRESPFPKINTLVDSYNLASAESCIPFAAFDLDKLKGEPFMREAKLDEDFLGIGMEKPLNLTGGEVVIQDEEKLIAVYPYRDADYSKVTVTTTSILLMDQCQCDCTAHRESEEVEREIDAKIPGDGVHGAGLQCNMRIIAHLLARPAANPRRAVTR